MVKLVLVDGAKGHTGTFLVKEILNSKPDWQIIATDLPTDSRKEIMTKEVVFKNLPYMEEVLKDPRVEYIPADLTKPETLEPLFKDREYDIIFHPASLYDYFALLEQLRKINVEGTRNLVDQIVKTQDLKKLRFIHWSTCGVYGQPKYEKDLKGYPIPADETAPYDPPNNYSRSKMEQEILLKEYKTEHELKISIIRPAPIIGPYQTYGAYHIFMMVNKLGWIPGWHIIPKKKRLAMPLVHVVDLARSAVFLAEDDRAIGEAFNLVINPCLQEDFLEYTAKLLNLQYFHWPISWLFYKIISKLLFWLAGRKEKKARKLGTRPYLDLPMAGYVKHNYLFSNEKLKLLGFNFKFPDYDDATFDTIDWYLKNGWLESE